MLKFSQPTQEGGDNILPKPISHSSYVNKVSTLFPNDNVVKKLILFDTSPLRKYLTNLYSSKGRPAYSPEDMLRSLIAMLLCGVFSIRKWANLLKNKDIIYYSAISGFSIKTPAHNTFSDFIKRISNNPKLLASIFFNCFVLPSVKLGLINIKKLILTIDSTKIKPFMNQFGKKICNHLRHKCSCPKKFSDKNATLGYDSYRDIFFRGYGLHILSDCSSDLPLFFILTGAHHHDSPIGYFIINLLYKHISKLSWSIFSFILDSAYDAIRIYKFIIFKLNAYPIIDLRAKPKPNINFTVNTDGVPVCKGKLNFVFWGFDQFRMFVKFRWPFILKSKKIKCKSCKLFPCSKSPYGRVIYTYPKKNFRLFTPIPRESYLWKKLSNFGSAKERINSVLKDKYGFSNLKIRGKSSINFRVFIAMASFHLEAQANSLFNLKDLPEAA